jgi:hypothetical protein
MNPIVVGNPQKFAIESCMTRAYDRPGLRALGYFVLHVGGECYGVKSDEATMLACSFDEVARRIARRGTHRAFFSQDSNADAIAMAVYEAIYGPENQISRFRGLSQRQMSELLHTHHIQWAPDGDEAFDDSSRVLHFDADDRVRLIAYKVETDFSALRDTVKDVWLEAVEFYGILECWRDAFETEWCATPENSEHPTP